MNFYERIIVIDTETTNSIDDPLCYDVGFTVIDFFGSVFERHSYVVKDIFFDEELMKSAYFKDKIPQYLEDIKEGKRIVKSFYEIKMIFRKVAEKYCVEKVVAHNARFDYRSLNLTQRFLTSSKYRYFFPYSTEIWDSLKMSRETLKTDEAYENFCYENNYLTKRLCRRYTAEILYKFISNNTNFKESHTALEDVEIEKEIVLFCVQRNPQIDGALWKREEEDE